MKKLFTLFCILFSFTAFSQFNNSWIDYNKTYYKFKIATTGLYRISFSTLETLGLSNVPMENFQLWRNGEEVILYTSAASGPASASDYIEFYGERNDGRPDKALYREVRFQHTDVKSLYTDSAAFFLTVNTGQNKRFITQANDVSAPPVAKEPYFMHMVGTYPTNKINNGYAAYVGEYVYSSSYDQGEYWSSNDIAPNATGYLQTFSSLQTYTNGPSATIRFGVSGNANNQRNVKVNLNNAEVFNKAMNFFSDSVFTINNIPVSSLNSAAVRVLNASGTSTDRMVVSHIEMTYPRKFDFGNATQFSFELPASPAGNYLEITNFNQGGVAPILYDLTNRQRYVVNNATAGVLKVMLQPSTVPRTLVLVGQFSSYVKQITGATQRNFIDFFNTANQGDYLIISNSMLMPGVSNPVFDYRNYRRSTQGGGYNAVVVDVDELEDQFAFGINKHTQSIKNFLAFARTSFATAPKHVFLIGRGVTYNQYYAQQAKMDAKRLNLIPTFGNPGSDNMLASIDSKTSVPLTPIGRLGVVTAEEVANYLNKVKEYEQAQRTPSCEIGDKAWMKNIMQVTGASDQYLGTVLCNYMQGYDRIISDSLFGGKVHTFCKTTTGIGQEAASLQIAKLFNEGVSMVNYFGHSSSSILEFNINDPETYENKGKYPVFYVNGCNAGNFFSYDVTRLGLNKTLTEKFTLAKEKGAIAFVASTHYGIVSYLNVYIDGLYKMIARTDYAKSLGEVHADAMQRILNVGGPGDFYSRMHAEQISIHGDPALKLNTFPKPDYAINEEQVKVSPAFLSIAETKFTVDVKINNLGAMMGDSLLVRILRERPDNSTDTLFYERIRAVGAEDSIQLLVPIVATRDKGTNRILVILDPDNETEELCETNNQIIKNLVIYEDEARPVYPYPFSIINKPVERFVASTSNPFGETIQYRFEMDTTEAFNSTLLQSQNITAAGGILEFTPGVNFIDSTVYYWRTAVVPQDGSDFKWSGASFHYNPDSESGWGQSHYYQMTKNVFQNLTYTDDRKISFIPQTTHLKFLMGLYPHNQAINSSIDDELLTFGACGSYFSSMVYMLFDKQTGKPIENIVRNGKGTYGSLTPVCPANGINVRYLFYYPYTNQKGRKAAIDFLDSVPNNTIVAMFNLTSDDRYGYNSTFIGHWMADTTDFGKDSSLYHTYKKMGLYVVDRFTTNIAFFALLETDKSGNMSIIEQQVGDTVTSTFQIRYSFVRAGNNGNLQSLQTGASTSWKSVQWKSVLGNPNGDQAEFRLYGVRPDFTEELVYKSSKPVQDTTLNFVDATVYPRLRLELHQQDEERHLPRQLEYWNIKYDEVPEGALSANLYFDTRDSVDLGEIVNLKIAFKNISAVDFDSLKLKVDIIDRNNVTHSLAPSRVKPLLVGDTVIIAAAIDTKEYPGDNTLYLEVNPDNDQPEEHHFNNFLFRNLYVKPDDTNPLMDVTFDGMHILNKDIVSSKPHIAIRLKDEAKFMPLNDTASVNVTLRYLENGGWTRSYRVDGDTLRFTPPANPTVDNTAVLDFLPALTQDGEYELTLTGKDRSENGAGNMEYKVIFQTYNKPMISNMLNYPNPFTTSTAFVFTLTGSEIPQNMRIQILTITGKVVREITKAELGPIRIGRNITEFKWDGTDQFGQKLANGIYLYRVITNLNGKSMDKFAAESDATDRFFNNGYGKMYLMR